MLTSVISVPYFGVTKASTLLDLCYPVQLDVVCIFIGLTLFYTGEVSFESVARLGFYCWGCFEKPLYVLFPRIMVRLVKLIVA